MLNIVDEYTGECPGIVVEWQTTATMPLDALYYLFIARGVPEYTHSDNCPDFTARAVRDWLARPRMKMLLIQPGSPREHGHSESFNGKLKDELLNRESVHTLIEARSRMEQRPVGLHRDAATQCPGLSSTGTHRSLAGGSGTMSRTTGVGRSPSQRTKSQTVRILSC